MKKIAIFMTLAFIGTVQAMDDLPLGSPSEVRIKNFRLPEDTQQWQSAIMTIVDQIFPDSKGIHDAFNELASFSCGPTVDLKATDADRRTATIQMSLFKLLELTTEIERVDYIKESLRRHRIYLNSSK